MIFHYAGKYNGDESRKDIYMYNDLANGLMFVAGTEDIAIMKERILNSCFTLIKYQRAQSTCCSFIDIKI